MARANRRELVFLNIVKAAYGLPAPRVSPTLQNPVSGVEEGPR